MQPQSTKDTYIVPQMSQEDITLAVDTEYPNTTVADAERTSAALERVNAAYDLDEQPGETERSGEIGSIAFDTARQETFQPAQQPSESVIDPAHPETLAQYQVTTIRNGGLRTKEMRDRYALGA